MWLRDDIGNHQGTSDRVMLGFYQRHPHIRMPVDYCLDLLRVNLESTNIDDAICAADEVIAPVVQFH
jgi:hypothetical protein